MNINRYALCKERSLQKIISKQPKPNTTAIGVCSETQVTHHIITKRSDECLPISAYVPKHKEGDGKKFPVIIDIYGGDFVAGRSALNRNFGTWCAEHGYLTFIPEYTPVPETNLFGQLGDLLKAFVVIHRCAERYGADMSRMYLVGDGAGAALACLVYALLWNPVSMQHLEDELPFDVPQEAKLTFKAVCLQNGILDLSSRKMNAIAPYLIEKDWKKTSYAECLSPKTYAKMLPPCFLVMSITDAHKRDTNQLAWQLKLKGTRYSVHSANSLFAKESFAARHPETRYAQAANTAMLALYICDKEDSDNDTQQYILKNLNSLGNSVDFWGRKNDRQHVIDNMSTTQKSQLLCYILRNHEAFGKMTCRDWKNWLLDDAESQFGIRF